MDPPPSIIIEDVDKLSWLRQQALDEILATERQYQI